MQEKMRPPISVCMATYNGETYIKPQLLSILSQLKSYDEIIISDDHSNDNTLSVIMGINDNRIKVVENKRDKGYVSNFENALSYAKGDIVFLSDQDDIWHIDKVSICLHYLQNNDFVVSDAIIIDKNGELLAESFYRLRSSNKSYLGNMLKFSCLGCCMAFKRSVLLKALPFPSNHKMCTHDNWIFLVSATFFKYKILDEKLIYYRRHDKNVSLGGLKTTTTWLFKIKYRIYLLIHLLRRF